MTPLESLDVDVPLVLDNLQDNEACLSSAEMHWRYDVTSCQTSRQWYWICIDCDWGNVQLV